MREVRAGLEALPLPIVAGVALLAAALVASGRPDAAKPILDRVLEGGSLRLPHDNLCSAHCADLGHGRRIGTEEQQTLPSARCSRSPTGGASSVPAARRSERDTTGSASSRKGRGDDAGAARHFGRAAALSDSAGATYWADVARKWIAVRIDAS